MPFSKRSRCHFKINLAFLIGFAIVFDHLPVVLAQGGPANVVVAPVVLRDVAAEQSLVANVNPWRRSVIGSAVDGRVLEYLVRAGQAVQEGDELAQLRTKTISIEIAAAEAQRELNMAELRELENGSRPDEIALAEALMAVAVANSQYARAKLTRAERLYKQGTGVSQDEFESAQAEAAVAAARVAEAESSFRLVKEGPRKEQIDQAAARVETQTQVVEGLKDREAKYTLRSPFNGFVSAELTQAGAWVRQGDPLAEVVEIDPVEVEVYVPEFAIQFITLGGTVNVSVEAYPGKVFEGTIERIVPLADSRARTFPVRIRVENPQQDSKHLLLPGMLARVSLPSGTVAPRLMVAKDALHFGGANPVVYRVVDNKAMMVPVRTGPSMGSWISVTPMNSSELNENDLVVTRGNERLRPGQDVLINSQQEPEI